MERNSLTKDNEKRMNDRLMVIDEEDDDDDEEEEEEDDDCSCLVA